MMPKETWEILRDSYWYGVREKLDDYIKFEMQKLKTCQPQELAAIQEGIRQLERLRNLPDDVIEAEAFGE